MGEWCAKVKHGRARVEILIVLLLKFQLLQVTVGNGWSSSLQFDTTHFLKASETRRMGQIP